MHDHAAFLHAFETATLSKAEWTHEAHIRMGWLYVRRYGGWEVALPHVRAGIQRLNAAINNSMGYHETITAVFLQLIDARMADSTEDWATFRTVHPDLFDYRNPIMLRHYSRERIFSPEARERFLEPDLTALPD